jgi:hypothetical protein
LPQAAVTRIIWSTVPRQTWCPWKPGTAAPATVRRAGLNRPLSAARQIADRIGQGRAGIARAVYAAVQGRTLIVLHVFVQKTPTTPRAAIETARTRLESMR